MLSLIFRGPHLLDDSGLVDETIYPRVDCGEGDLGREGVVGWKGLQIVGQEGVVFGYTIKHFIETGVIEIDSVKAVAVGYSQGIFYQVGTLCDIAFHLVVPKSNHPPAHLVEPFVYLLVTKPIAFDFSIPKFTIGMDAIFVGLPVFPMPKLAIDKDCDFAGFETDVGGAWNSPHIAAVADASAPQFGTEKRFAFGAFGFIGLHATTTLFGCQMVNHLLRYRWGCPSINRAWGFGSRAFCRGCASRDAFRRVRQPAGRG